MVANLAQAALWLGRDPVSRARTGQSPNEVIHRDGKARVRYFHPREGLAAQAPLFCVMPLINTWTVFDLAPGRSVVEALTAQGVPVYILDWGRAGPEDRHTPLCHYVDRVIGRCLDRACRHAGVPDMNVLGYCVGGTFLAAHLARSNRAQARAAFFLATPIDFRASGRLSRWARPESFPLDAIVDGLGNFPRELMQESFRWLRPMGLAAKYKGLVDRFDDEGFRELWSALEAWNNDGVDFPGEAYREYVRRCYFDNALVEGGWVMDGRAVDLGRANIPVTAVAAGDDHIVPPEAAHALAGRWGGPVTTGTLKGGHVGVCAGGALPRRILEWHQS